MAFLGEHLLPGQLGHFFAVLSLVASLVATISYFKATQLALSNEAKSWQRIARAAFAIETICVVGLFVVLYYIISAHLFEYKYAWQHSSKSLQVEYLLSCFWEGQEGSFMLWSFWHCVLGWILIWRAKSWEAPVMTTVSFAQFCLATMLLGVYIFGKKIGSSPFVLLRNEMDWPFLAMPDYLSKIQDGNGLNALLQNYWMVIHPPVLFLGFASTIVPFAYAIAGLWTKRHNEWVKPVIPWASFSGGILGLGIMMGAAWAYESLTFGGYWAWDPVENASMVPWLVLIAGLHTNLIYRHSGYSLKSTYVFYILTFILILYSTFLTRSGVLGDTSVHAFTDLGMNWQLLIFILVFLIPSFWLYFSRSKGIPSIQKEENTYSREFWMFIGSLVLFLSGTIIIVMTSLPVINKIFGTKLAVGEDVEFSHNQIQIFVAIVIGLLAAVTQYLKYKDTPKKVFYQKIAIPTIIALIISLSISIGLGIDYDKKGAGFLGAIHLAMFAAVYSVTANASYIWLVLKGKIKAAGSSVAHVGFGLMLVGILISSANKKILSWNTTGMSPLKIGERESPLENLTLVKGVSTDMGKYMVTYVKDSFNTYDRKRYYEINFKSKTSTEQFSLYPDIIENNKGQEGATPNPDSKHYWHKDIFTYLTYLADPAKAAEKDTSSFRTLNGKPGDTLYYSKGLVVLNKVSLNPPNEKYNFSAADTALMLDVTVISKDGRQYKAMPGILVENGQTMSLSDTVMSQSLIVRLDRLKDYKTGEFEIGLKETAAVLDFVTLKAYEFPFINLLWLGIIIMTIGFVMSMIQRSKRLS
jgi:cytochrome c-type biogenesis protein CcmF